ncbi:uncharacterized protein LOC133549500 isoform X3 [Nerophis ophidion]|uniref:uncharacterized protein LOC133549500 isoform X3 n=1 Tax=Nerophis ophidion TaxID=159077 RepID=UPI002ADFF701|nr:uncharacterized protein LOC133549500 isoform X3 [Nerophis ophidion]
MRERTAVKHEEEVSPTKDEKQRQHEGLDDVCKKHHFVSHTTDVQQPPRFKEEDPHSLTVKEKKEEPQPAHIKEEEEELWIAQEGERLLGQEEDDLTKFPLTGVPVKTEEREEKPPVSSQLHPTPSKQNIQTSVKNIFSLSSRSGL